MKRIILCADDYGQNNFISQAIILLIKKNRLTATTCMTTSRYWLESAAPLKSFDKLDIGLHFNLTEGKSLSQAVTFLPLKKLLIKSFLKKINQASIETELHAQLDQFEAGMGRLPDFIDGHQHVHQFPIVREALLSVYQKRLKNHLKYLRSVQDRLTYFRWGDAYLKRVLIQNSGANSFKKQLLYNKIRHNPSFSGIYSFSKSDQYRAFFNQFLAKIMDNGIIMCHPGLSGDDYEDTIRQARYDEYCYLNSQHFVEDCLKQDVKLGQFNLLSNA